MKAKAKTFECGKKGVGRTRSVEKSKTIKGSEKKKERDEIQ